MKKIQKENRDQLSLNLDFLPVRQEEGRASFNSECAMPTSVVLNFPSSGVAVSSFRKKVIEELIRTKVVGSD